MSASISESVLIDLGERDRAVEWPRPARRRVPRLTAAIALVAVTILIPTSSQRARPVIAPALWRAPGTDNFVVDKDRVYLINRPGDGTGDGYDGVTALSARTGATLWRLRWQHPVTDVAVLSGGILAVSTHPELIGEPVTAPEPTVHVVDADGGLLAEFPGVVMRSCRARTSWLSCERHSICGRRLREHVRLHRSRRSQSPHRARGLAIAG